LRMVRLRIGAAQISGLPTGGEGIVEWLTMLET
jgi:hypothetical protein